MINVGLLKVVNIRVVMTKIIKNMNIFNKTKNKKLFLIAFVLIFVFSFLAASTIMAQGGDTVPTTEQPKCDIKFIPNISIPGSDFLKSEEGVCLGTDSIGFYIVALYRYGAILAGVVAMFMLVFAGWQWLMAAGRADQITKAKDTIVGVFVGLALLFGGYLLMSQISQNSVNFADLKMKMIPAGVMPHKACEVVEDVLIEKFGDTYAGKCKYIIPQSLWEEHMEEGFMEQKGSIFDSILCVSSNCPEGNKCMVSYESTPCPSAIPNTSQEYPDCTCVPEACNLLNFNPGDGVNGCAGYYQILNSCLTNKCLGKEDRYGRTMNQVCGINRMDKCVKIEDVPCDYNSDCDYDGSGTYCCEDSKGMDWCRVATEIDNCMTN